MLGILGLLLVQATDVLPRPTAMNSLSEQELRSRIVGKQIKTTDKPPPGLDYVKTEWFTKDGRYYRFFHGHEALGSYRLVGESVCVRLYKRERCRTGFIDTNGDFWLLSKDENPMRLERYAVTESPR